MAILAISSLGAAAASSIVYDNGMPDFNFGSSGYGGYGGPAYSRCCQYYQAEDLTAISSQMITDARIWVYVDADRSQQTMSNSDSLGLPGSILASDSASVFSTFLHDNPKSPGDKDYQVDGFWFNGEAGGNGTLRGWETVNAPPNGNNSTSRIPELDFQLSNNSSLPSSSTGASSRALVGIGLVILACFALYIVYRT